MNDVWISLRQSGGYVKKKKRFHKKRKQQGKEQQQGKEREKEKRNGYDDAEVNDEKEKSTISINQKWQKQGYFFSFDQQFPELVMKQYYDFKSQYEKDKMMQWQRQRQQQQQEKVQEQQQQEQQQEKEKEKNNQNHYTLPCCMSCGRQVGTRFEILYDASTGLRRFLVTCGAALLPEVSTVCGLNVDFMVGRYKQLSTSIAYYRGEIDKTKAEIIQIKNANLFYLSRHKSKGNGQGKDKDKGNDKGNDKEHDKDNNSDAASLEKFSTLVDRLEKYSNTLGVLLEMQMLRNGVSNPVTQEEIRTLESRIYRTYIPAFRKLSSKSDSDSVDAVSYYVEMILPALNELMALKYKWCEVVTNQRQEHVLIQRQNRGLVCDEYLEKQDALRVISAVWKDSTLFSKTAMQDKMKRNFTNTLHNLKNMPHMKAAHGKTKKKKYNKKGQKGGQGNQQGQGQEDDDDVSFESAMQTLYVYTHKVLNNLQRVRPVHAMWDTTGLFQVDVTRRCNLYPDLRQTFARVLLLPTGGRVQFQTVNLLQSEATATTTSAATIGASISETTTDNINKLYRFVSLALCSIGVLISPEVLNMVLNSVIAEDVKEKRYPLEILFGIHIIVVNVETQSLLLGRKLTVLYKNQRLMRQQFNTMTQSGEQSKEQDQQGKGEDNDDDVFRVFKPTYYMFVGVNESKSLELLGINLQSSSSSSSSGALSVLLRCSELPAPFVNYIVTKQKEAQEEAEDEREMMEMDDEGDKQGNDEEQGKEKEKVVVVLNDFDVDASFHNCHFTSS